MTIGLVTDSNAQLPPELASRYGIEVVPIHVTVDGVAFREGVDLTADDFYARFETRTPEVTTSQPSPGEFVDAYRRLAAAGAREILSVHVTEALSGTINAARLAVPSSPVPVRLVDSGTASFGVSCCVWEAAESLAAGADLEEAARVAEHTAASVGTVFIVQALDLAARGGRFAVADLDGGGIPVLTYEDGELVVVGEAHTVDEANDLMAARILAGGDDLRVAIGVADASAAPYWEALERRVAGHPRVRDLVRYRVGPSVGVHTGPGTAGAFFHPVR